MLRIRRILSVAGLAMAMLLALQGFGLQPVRAANTLSLSLAIYKGNCFNVAGDPVYELTKLTRKSGTSIRALPAFSESTVDAPLADLQAKPHSIVVTRKGKLNGTVACGEINTIALADGTVAVGLREQLGSLYAGIALLTADGNKTQIRAYVGAGLATGDVLDNGADEAPSVDVTVSVTVDNTEITADQTTFSVGTSVEFIVTNNGTDPHEVMLEPAGADETPLENSDGSQAETEDMAPGDSVSFVYTFTAAGDFQLADHIGSDSQVLPITVES